MWQVSEVFRSIQGEGIRTGVPSVFVRLAGCNFRCKWRCDKKGPGGRVVSTYVECDTEYAQNAIQTIGPVPDTKALAAIIKNELRATDDIIITGGEPTVQSIELFNDDRHMRELLDGRSVTLETNGTGARSLPWVDILSISPKINTIDATIDSNAKYARRVAELICANNNAVAQLKFVVANLHEIEIIHSFIENMISGLAYVNNKGIEYLLMPVSTNPNHYDTFSKELANYILESNFNFRFCDRLHQRLWKGERAK